MQLQGRLLGRTDATCLLLQDLLLFLLLLLCVVERSLVG
jgi:hypothetical protein